MKIKKEGLDRTHVYDLRGITEDQVKELSDWLIRYDDGWYKLEYRRILEDYSLEYSNTEWFLSGSKPTTHISTLFEKPYKQQLQEAKKKLEHYKKEVERLESESKPKVGDFCKFWDNFESDFVIGILTAREDSDFPYQVADCAWFKNAKTLTEQEVIDFLFKKS